MAKSPPKSTIDKNIMNFLHEQEGADLKSVSVYLDLQESITLALLGSLVNRGYVSIVANVYHPNYLYNQIN